MIRALSLAAALAVLPLTAAVAQEAPADPEVAIEAAAEAFEVRMEEFGARAELISEDATLTEEQRGTRIAALWTEYQPDVDAFTGVVSDNIGLLVGGALADIDMDALVSEALEGVEMDVDVMAMAQGFVGNGAWASTDPEHMATYGLMADYAMNQVEDADLAAVEADTAAAEADAAAHD